jgi:chromosome segregation ATPase
MLIEGDVMDVNRSSHLSTQYGQYVDTADHSQKTSNTATDNAGHDSKTSAHSSPGNSYHEPLPSRGGSQAYRPRSLSETRIHAQLSLDENEKVISLTDFDKSVENFGEFFASHTVALHHELDSMKATVGELSASLAAIKNQKSNLEQSVSARKEGAKARAISRENTIKDLQAENEGLNLYKDQSETLMAKMQEAVDSMQKKLGNLNNELGGKSKVISSQSNTIKKIKENSKEVKGSHQEDLEEKDRIIVNVKQQLNNLQSELDTEKQKTALLQSQLDAISSTERHFTPAKSDALVKTGKKISDQSEVLQNLNTKLLEERKVMAAQNKENKEEIAQLKGRLIQLARLAGIDLPEAS